MKRFLVVAVMFATLLSLVLFWPSPRASAAATLDTSSKYKIVNQNSGLVLGISNASQTAGTTTLQWTDTGAADHLWHFMPNGGSVYKIENMNSGELLGISGASKSSGAAVLQWGDNGTADHLWQFIDAGSGLFKIVNQNSKLVLGVSNASQSAGAAVIQSTDNGSTDHLWRLVAAGASYVGPGSISGTTSIHDPSLVRTANGTYYAFSTTLSGTGLQMRSSTDRIHFTDAGRVFTTIPSWTNSYNGGNGSLWAPDVSFHNGKYWLYYAASSFGSQNSAIGLATSTTAAPGSWSDQGVVYTSSAGGDYNAIDP
ncbi:MAG TPA: RICIN domain-containing protein, partial [Ktedonobacteraceae bacterium]|nr:RICIN domain-containing protein [Ktedonobacteraceae bacterium]